MDIKEKKLIEKCARVAQYLPLHKKAVFSSIDGNMSIEVSGPCGLYLKNFNPIYENSDVAKLEADLMLNIVWSEDGVKVGTEKELFSKYNGDKQMARRMACVKSVSKMFIKEKHTIFPI